ncbi:MYND-type domain-containing protein [Trichonephila clavata]|uniref:MYND-type domain-containing protein n=1 Tax=Trichonephila clavata TaxID=2740835 RepID=A0A8X6JTX0_TRICU|nr:MYND-type domain-containing protein [Trichonephila clavata]
MRAVNLISPDNDLFDPNLDYEKNVFFCSHLPAFKRMWTEEGKVYWLRFLVTFKMHLESNLHHPKSDTRLTNFIFINIHKHFVEGTYNVVKNFIVNIFVAANNFHSLNEPSLPRNPFYNKESREAFRALLGKPEFHEEIPVPAVGFVCSLYFEFTSAVCTLLKKWIQEPDLEPELESNIDVSFFYWQPFDEWKQETYVANCFEKYLAQCWNEELSVMLLISDIHNIFNNHNSKNCCDYEKDISFFDFLKKKENPCHVCIPHIKILKPFVSKCIIHDNCCLKILHNEKCREPFLCDGVKPCILVCELTSQKRRQNFNNFQLDPWKKWHVETFECKDANRRSVCTYVQSHNIEIETYLLEDQVCEIDTDSEKPHIDDWLIWFRRDGADARNAYNQHKQKEKLKRRLRSKLSRKYNFSIKDFEDSAYCCSLYEEANSAWILDMCDQQYSLHGNSEISETENNCNNSLKKLRKWLPSVAISTDDIIHGRVVYPRPHTCKHMNINDCEISLHECKAKSRKSRSKKNKSSASIKIEVKSPPDAASSSGTSEVDTKERFKYCSAIGGVPYCHQEKNDNLKEIKICSDITVKSAQTQCNIRKDVSKSCKKVGIKKISAITGKELQHLPNCPNKGKEIQDTDHRSPNPSTNGITMSYIEEPKLSISACNIDKGGPQITSKTKYDLSKKIKGRDEKVNTDDINAVDRFFDLIGVKVNTSAQEMGVEDSQFNNHDDLENFDAISQCADVLINNVNVVEITSEADGISSYMRYIDTDADNQNLKKKLHFCAFCMRKEPQHKTFKRCAQCKVDNYREQHYYCSKICQIDHWSESHRAEHLQRAAEMNILKQNVQDMLEGIVEVQGILCNNNTLQCEKIINFPLQMTEKFDLALFNETMVLVEHLPNHYAVLA